LVIHTESRRVGHHATEAAWAEATALARKRHSPAVPIILTSDERKAVRKDATTKVGLELLKHEGGHFAAHCFQRGSQ